MTQRSARWREVGRLWLGVTALGALMFGAGALWSSGGELRDWLQNPLQFSSRVAPSGPVVLQQVQKLARLETSRYNGQVIVRGETSSGWVPTFVAGDKMVFVAHGEVVAGVDLSKMEGSDVQVSGEKVRVRLPEADVFHTRLDSGQSEVFERQTGWLSQPDRTLESRVRVKAEDQLREAALSTGLLADAQKNAEDAVREQLKLFGVKDVTFE